MIARALWIVVALAACKNDDRPPTDAERKALAEYECPSVRTPHFYRVEKAGKVSYLLGTRHASVALAKYPKNVAAAFHASKVLVTETTYPEGEAHESQRVSEVLSPDAWSVYKKIVGDDAAKRIDPLGVQMATAQLVLLYEDVSQTLDVELVNMARAEGKRLVGLEDPEKGAMLTDDDSLGNAYLGQETLEKLLKSAHRRTVFERDTRLTLRTYCNGGKLRTAGDLDHLTNQRTRSWMTSLVPILDEGDAFVAVGSAHVDAGSLDLTELLAQEGFSVRAIPTYEAL